MVGRPALHQVIFWVSRVHACIPAPNWLFGEGSWLFFIQLCLTLRPRLLLLPLLRRKISTKRRHALC